MVRRDFTQRPDSHHRIGDLSVIGGEKSGQGPRKVKPRIVCTYCNNSLKIRMYLILNGDTMRPLRRSWAPG